VSDDRQAGSENDAAIAMMLPPTSKIFFYVPSSDLVKSVPSSISEYWEWADDFIRRFPAKLPDGRDDCTWIGPYNWTVQTFIHLRDDGFPCELTASLPTEGIIIAHGDFLPASLVPSAKQFVVEIKPDRSLQCIFANFVIVQNRHDPIQFGVPRLLIRSAYVNYWPQPGLMVRDSNRGDRFENVCFMGNHEQFLRQTDVLEAEIRRLGLRWTMMPREKWHDYREVDAIVAIRPSDSGAPANDPAAAVFATNRKPASKLFNAWLAGVPAVLSSDVAYRDLRKSELDYLEANNIPEVVDSLRQLMDNAGLRRSVVENGRRRAPEFSADETLRAWKAIIGNLIVPEYAAWSRSSLRRGRLYLTRTMAREITSRWGISIF
jgi:hypothetical protein